MFIAPLYTANRGSGAPVPVASLRQGFIAPTRLRIFLILHLF